MSFDHCGDRFLRCFYIKPKPVAETSVLVDPLALSPPGSSIRAEAVAVA
jgi:hypothetical protein